MDDGIFYVRVCGCVYTRTRFFPFISFAAFEIRKDDGGEGKGENEKRLILLLAESSSFSAPFSFVDARVFGHEIDSAPRNMHSAALFSVYRRHILWDHFPFEQFLDFSQFFFLTRLF